MTAKPKAKLRMGSINGETTMAPMTTAVLLEISPRVVITAELKKNEEAKRWLG